MRIWSEVVMVLVLVAGVNSAALGNPDVRAQDNAIASAIDRYNREQNTRSVFRLLDAGMKDRPVPSTSPHQVMFIIKETECVKPVKTNIEKCPFKDGGIVKNCSASTTDEKTSASVVQCDTVNNKPLFVSSRKLDDWKINGDDKEKAKGEVDTRPPGTFQDLLYKLQTNLTGPEEPEEPACFSCVLCEITNSC